MNLYPIDAIYPTANSLYVVIFSGEYPALSAWNPTLLAGAGAWEAYNSAHWSQYAIAMGEATGSGYYSTAYPTNISLILTTDVIYIQGGVSPVVGDSPLIATKSQGANVAAIGGASASALNLGVSTGSMQAGTLIGTPTAMSLPTDLISTEYDTYAGRAIIMISGQLKQQVSPITSYDGTTFTLTIVGFPSGLVPLAGDEFIII